MKESKMSYIVKRLSKKLDEKQDEAINFQKYYDEQMNKEGLERFIEALKYKCFWAGYSMALNYCRKLASELATDVKELENEEISDE